MKKRLLALMMAGIMSVAALTACGDEGTDNTKKESEKEKDEEKEEKKEEKEEETEDEGVDDVPSDTILSYFTVWERDKTMDTWIQIDEDGSWTMINYSGEVAETGSWEIAADDDTHMDLIDSNGDIYITMSFVDETTLFDETYQETWTNIGSLPEFDNGPDVSVLSRDWIYQVTDPDDPSAFIAAGYVYVDNIGNYSYTDNDSNETVSGTVVVNYEQYENGEMVPYLAFYEGGNNFWIGCYYDESDPDTFYIGNGGMERLVRLGEGQGTVDLSGTYTEPVSGRCQIELNSTDGIYYTAYIRWASSAYESAVWEINYAVYGESSGEVEYTDAYYYVRTYTDDVNYTDEVGYTDGTGRFWIDADGMLNWVSDQSDIDGVDGSTTFEKID